MRLLRWLLVAVVIVVAAYGLRAASTWMGYGKRASIGGRGSEGGDARSDVTASSLDRFLPAYEVSESHQTEVAAPVDVAFEAARELDLQKSPLAKIIFKSRRILMGGTGPDTTAYRTTLEQIRALGWSVLEERPGRSMVFGAVTRPWEANVRFRGLPPDEFAAFQEPGYAKIVWTLEAEPVDGAHSIVRTRTRVATTDPDSRRRFRVYWSQFSPGIVLIRKQALGVVKAEAERRARAGAKPPA